MLQLLFGLPSTFKVQGLVYHEHITVASPSQKPLAKERNNCNIIGANVILKSPNLGIYFLQRDLMGKPDFLLTKLRAL